MIRKFFTLIGSLILIFIIVIVALPFLLPIESYKNDVLKLAEEKTGRQVTIEGSLDLKFLPNIALQVNDMTVHNPEGFVSSHFAKIGELDLQVALWPLLEKKIEINQLAIDNAEFFVEEAVGGRKNWEFDNPKNKEKTISDTPSIANPNFKLNIDKIDIQNTKVNYLKPGQKFTTEKLNLDYSDNVSDLDVVIKHGGTSYHVDLETKDTNSLFEDKATPLTAKLRSPLIKADIIGSVSGLNLSNGSFNPSIIGNLVSTITGVGKVTSREFSANLKQASLGVMSMETQMGVNGTGSMMVNYAGAKPKITTTLSIPKLNLDELMPSQDKQANLLNFIARPAHAAEGWSRKAINLAMLNMVNADANVTIGELITSGYNLSNFKSNFALDGGKMNISNFSTALLGGSLNGSGNLASSGEWALKTTIAAMPFQNLAKQFTDKVAIAGDTNANLSFSSNGNSLHDWMHRLSGGGSLTIGQGKISGFKMGELFRKTAAAVGSVVESESGLSTPFNSINVNFSADNGVLKLREGALRADRLKADATGSINLAEKTIDVLLTPETIPPSVKEGETEKQYSGLMVAVMVKGAFGNITVKPDYSRTIGNVLKDALKDPTDLKGLKLQGKSIEDAFEPTKDVLKENWKNLKENKDTDAFNNIMQELENNGLNPIDGLRVPSLPKKENTQPAPAPTETVPAEAAPVVEEVKPEIAPEQEPKPSSEPAAAIETEVVPETSPASSAETNG